MKITIFPNPTFSEVTILGSEEELTQIRVLNAMGQDVTSLTRQIGKSDSRRLVEMVNLRPGLYFIKTKSAVNKVQKR
jgi:hypothetical protein